MLYRRLQWLRLCPFKGGGSVVVDWLFIVALTVYGGSVLGPCFCYSVFYVLLVLQSLWCGRESLLLYCNCLPDVLWLLVFCGSFSWCQGLGCIVWLWYMLIIITCTFSYINPSTHKQITSTCINRILKLKDTHLCLIPIHLLICIAWYNMLLNWLHLIRT